MLRNIQSNYYTRTWFSNSNKCLLRRLPYLYMWLDENHDDYPNSLYEKWNHEQQKYNLAKDSLHQQRITAYENEIIELKHTKNALEDSLDSERAYSSYILDGWTYVVTDRNITVAKAFWLGLAAGAVIAAAIMSFFLS